MLGLGFLHPLLLWALPLAAVPIIIHLLNRRRYQRVRWAAQEFLLNALKRNRRRLKMEQWLILLLRTLAVLLLVLFVTRPQLSGSVLGETRTHHVVVVDDSASMGHRGGTTSAFEEAIDRVRSLADSLAESRGGDALTLLCASRLHRPDLAGVRINPQLKGRVRDALAGFVPGDGVHRPVDMLAAAIDDVEELEGPGRAEIYLLTDQREHDWLDGDGDPYPDLLAALRRLDPDRHRLTLIDLAPKDAENVGVVAVRRAGRVGIVGVPVDVEVTVQNFGLNASTARQLALQVDGRSRVALDVDALAPGERRVLTFSHTFATPGAHGAVAELPPDRYAVDDTRAVSIDVREASHVLLVDGDPGNAPEEAETYYLAFALEHRESGISVEVVPDHVLGDLQLERFDLIYLCNVPLPDAPVVARLEQFVAGGGGLVLFTGEQVNETRYNEALYRDGAGLLPARLGDVDGDLDRPRPVLISDRTHGTVALATEAIEQVLALAGVGRYHTLKELEGARTVLRIGRSDGPPLLVTRRYGGKSSAGGEVLLFTSTADMAWNTLARTPVYLIVSQQMHRVAARVHDQSTYNQTTEGLLALGLDPAIYRSDVAVRALREDALARTFTAQLPASERRPGEEPQEVMAELEISMRDLDGTGLFELELHEHDGTPERRLLARNAPALESDLRRLTRAAWVGAFPEDVRDCVTLVEREAAEAALVAGQENETWRALALAMLAVLLLESVLAWRFSGS